MALSALRDPGALLDSQAWVSIPATSQLRVSTGSVLTLLPSPPCFPWEGNTARKGLGEQDLGAHFSMRLPHIPAIVSDARAKGTPVTGKLLLLHHQLCKLSAGSESQKPCCS